MRLPRRFSLPPPLLLLGLPLPPLRLSLWTSVSPPLVPSCRPAAPPTARLCVPQRSTTGMALPAALPLARQCACPGQRSWDWARGGAPSEPMWRGPPAHAHVPHAHVPHTGAHAHLPHTRAGPVPQTRASASAGERATGSGGAREDAGWLPLRGAPPPLGVGPWASAAAPGESRPCRCMASSAPARAAAATERSSYGAEHIQVLEGLEPVRKRPGMYIGNTGVKGLHHLVWEVVDNAVDEAQAGHATHIQVLLRHDGAVRVTDNGRGIPVDLHPVTGKSALETVLTVLHAGGKFGGESSGYRVSGGLHGVGVSVVNALSEFVEVTVWRGGHQYWQRFERGSPVGALQQREVGPHQGQEEAPQGTSVLFLPDPQIFTTTTAFDFATISSRLRELAFLNPQAILSVCEGASEGDAPWPHARPPEGQEASSGQGSGQGSGGRRVVYHFQGGLQEYVTWLTSDKEAMHAPISCQRSIEDVEIAVAFQWCSDHYSDNLLGYANSIRTADGGTHMEGFRAAVTRVCNTAARKLKLLRDKDESLAGEHVREGLSAVVAVKVGNPEFEGQTKTRLGNSGVRRAVDMAVSEALTAFFDSNVSACEAVLSKAVQALRAAEAAKKARELVRRKSVLRSSALPGKLADCSAEDPRRSEIFIVEGDSAGGSTKQGRDRRFQAVLPLRGKILNVERKDDAVVYKNTELQNLILGLGLGLRGEDFDAAALRYHTIILLTDADVDGAHIRTLLLTFLFRYQKALFENGHVFVGVPPLYKVEMGRSSQYCYSEGELQALLRDRQQSLGSGQTVGSPAIQRFKGLGEMMPEQLWTTTLDPSKRRLKQITVDEAVEAEKTLSLLMGDKVGPRKELILARGTSMCSGMLDI